MCFVNWDSLELARKLVLQERRQDGGLKRSYHHRATLGSIGIVVLFYPDIMKKEIKQQWEQVSQLIFIWHGFSGLLVKKIACRQSSFTMWADSMLNHFFAYLFFPLLSKMNSFLSSSTISWMPEIFFIYFHYLVKAISIWNRFHYSTDVITSILTSKLPTVICFMHTIVIFSHSSFIYNLK